MPRRNDATTDRKGATFYIISALFGFIINVVVFYTVWHLLARYNIVTGEPSSGWNWLLAMRAMWSNVDRFTDDLEARHQASGSDGFWGPYRLKALANATEAVAFSSIIFHLGWLSIVHASDYAILLLVAITANVAIAALIIAGRLRDPPWLARIDDVATGAVGGAFFPALAYFSLWLNSNPAPANEIIWYGGIGICAAIGGGMNLWRKTHAGSDPTAP